MKIIVYDDNPDFGGHQRMACQGIEALASDSSNEVICMLNPGNRRLAGKIAAIESCQILVCPGSARSMKSRIEDRGTGGLQRAFEKLEADLVLCIQGDIKQSSQALIAARKAGIDCISYIALPHRAEAMGAKLGKLRDQANQYLFSQPTRFITISGSMEELLRERGVKQRIDIVPNGIAMPHEPCPNRQKRCTVPGLLGRVEFKQKQQDFMVRTFCDFQQAFENSRLIVAGDGPDRHRLEQLVNDCPRKAEIDILPWQEDTEAFYSSIDLLVIPSRYEGVPLVMLEALARGIPVIGSDRDGMRDILPREWTFDPENAAALAETFSRVRDNCYNDIGSLRERMLSEHSLEAFRSGFRQAVLQQ